MTLLCLDIRNNYTVVGLFDADRLQAHWRVASDERRTADEWHVLISGLVERTESADGVIDAIAVASTVPVILHEMRELISRRYGGCQVSIVEPGTKTGVPILTDNPREIGADRIVNALAGVSLYGGPCVIVDFGTATTFDVVNDKAQFIGGVIAPGMGISLDALARRGSQLRAVELVRPRNVIAKNTVEAIQSGMVFGFAGQVDGIVDRIGESLGVSLDDLTVVATGVYADVVREECDTISDYEPMLTLIGLRLVHERNHA
ncbi:pantothenate kinase [Antricoccus suffuscus]|uniref:Type III pantothenate kinase n=1 Tax=Antricoccus suffuscus TaxID=1629062 RepID=A0A2T0ZXH4_9ACTN|nr:type III pantothenate kinase [Antricoccus suffuscus]PRZ40778.1 pantothenate kinase [Antricoccus suffuscus]